MTRLDHVNLTVTDLEKSMEWYGQLFGFEKVEGGVTPYGRKWAIIAINDSMIAMSEMPDAALANKKDHGEHRIYHFGLRIDNADDWRQKVERFGLRLYYGGEIEYPHSRSWYIHDPSGHEIEVSWSEGKPMRFGG